MTTIEPLMVNYSNTNSSYVEPASLPPWMTYLRVTLYSTLLVLSLVGNVLIIVVVLCNNPLRTLFNYLIMNMSVSDLTVPLVALPLEIAKLLKYKDTWIVDGVFGNALCKVLNFIIDVSAPVSVLSLVAVAINRFFASVYPVRRKLMSSKMTKCLLVLAWVLPFLFYSFHFYRVKLDSTNKCVYSWQPLVDASKEEQANSIYIKLNVLLFFVIPLIVITILYSVVIYKLRMSTRSLSRMVNNQQLQKRKRANKHIFHMSLVIILAFAVFWGPFEVLLWIYSSPPLDEHILKVIKRYGWVAQLLGFFTVVVNPITCFGFFKNYRNGLKKVFNSRSRNIDEEGITNYSRGRHAERNPKSTKLFCKNGATEMELL